MTDRAVNQLDIIIPVYNEAENIVPVLDSLKQYVKTPSRILICYDHDDDTTLPPIRHINNNDDDFPFPIIEVKNRRRGVHGAVVTGFDYSDAPAALVLPADDTFNAKIIDQMFQKFMDGCDIVAASRFMKGGYMRNCPLLKAIIVRTVSFTLHRIALIPIKDASNGFRLFSRRLLDQVHMQSTRGFTYSLELLVKCHRLRWKIAEVPAAWNERTTGKSRFKIIKWLPYYFRWYIYGFVTTYLRRAPDTVKLKTPG